MTTPTIDMSRLVSSLAPREYNGGSAQEGLAFASSAGVYHGVLIRGGVPENIAWMMVLNRLTGDAAKWANPHIVTAATSAPWNSMAEFTTAFKAQFCAVDDKEAAITELVKLCKTSHKLGTVKDYTAEFNAAAARTGFSDEDKRERYRQGLPYRIKDEFATTAHDISTLSRAQTVALKMDQQLATRAEEKPRVFSYRNRGGKIAATDTPSFQGVCRGCNKYGHKIANCPDRRKNSQQVAASSSSPVQTTPSPAPTSSSTASDELVALRAQIKAMEERIAALTVAKEQENF